MNVKTMRVTHKYIAAVTNFADEHKNQKFLNNSHSHANLLAELMIGRAGEYDDVFIYSKSLPLSCFGDALAKSKSKRLQAILSDKGGEENIKKLHKDVQKKIEYRFLKEIDGAHFWIAGDSFRLEIGNGNAMAVANFNDSESVEILRTRFERLWSRAA